MNGSVNLLMVEDDAIDVMAMQRALANREAQYPLWLAKDGQSALALLRGSGGKRVPLPRIVLLDLNLPGKGGIDFLGELRQDTQLVATPVFVITTSNNARERDDAFRLGAGAYILKERLAGDYTRLLRLIDCYNDLGCLQRPA